MIRDWTRIDRLLALFAEFTAKWDGMIVNESNTHNLTPVTFV